MDDKIIVSNRAALTAKYGSVGLAKIKQAVTALIATDATRGIKSRLVYLDDTVAMKSFKGKPVTDPGDYVRTRQRSTQFSKPQTRTI